MRRFFLPLLFCAFSKSLLAIDFQSEDALAACEPASLVVDAVQMPSCIVPNLESLSDAASYQWVHIHDSFDSSVEDSISSAQSMTLKQLKNSSFLKPQRVLVVSEDLLMHFDPAICKTFRELGFDQLKILAYGVAALRESNWGEVKVEGRESASKSISAAQFIERYPHVDFQLIASSQRVSQLLDELDLQHKTFGKASSFRQQVFNVVATAGLSPVLVVGEADKRGISSWVNNASINQLFSLEGGVERLFIERQRVHHANASRLGINNRFRCAKS